MVLSLLRAETWPSLEPPVLLDVESELTLGLSADEARHSGKPLRGPVRPCPLPISNSANPWLNREEKGVSQGTKGRVPSRQSPHTGHHLFLFCTEPLGVVR